MAIRPLLLGAVATLVLAGCADDEVILEGERLSVRSVGVSDAVIVPEPEVEIDTSFVAPEVTKNADWTHPYGTPTHTAGHPDLSRNPQLIWSTGVGQGNSRKHRITSAPVVADGIVYTIDSRATVTATSVNGDRVWSASLVPPSERERDASGGGVSVDGGRVFATTGFGEVIALDAGNGSEVWRQRINAPATSAPTVSDGLVYAVGRDNRAWAIDADTGRVKWDIPGTPDVSGMIGGVSPAVTGRVAIFPFGSGELVAALRLGGVRLWGSQISGKRAGRAYANISDITADPVVAGDVVYTGNQSGRAVALSLNSGERLWTARDGSYGPVAVAGNSVFLISDQAELIRLDAATGERVWAEELPYFRRERARRSRAIFAHFGPVFAGGQLWVASDDGTLKSYNPETGEAVASLDIPGGAASSMAVAGGTMYVLSGRGQLHAFR